MLYDPRWEAKTEPTSLKSLIGWLETQPEDGVYIHTHGEKCMLGQWLAAVAPGSRYVTAYIYHVNGRLHDFKRFSGIACGLGPKDRTFGLALKRARPAA